jgi:hypothetical protein
LDLTLEIATGKGYNISGYIDLKCHLNVKIETEIGKLTKNRKRGVGKLV